jgi:hypothetical protein
MLRAAVAAVLLLTGCPPNEPPVNDGCQVNVDCTVVQLDACCGRSTCDEDLSAETSERTRARRDVCSRKDCVSKQRVPCSTRHPKVMAACRDGKCVLEAVR